MITGRKPDQLRFMAHRAKRESSHAPVTAPASTGEGMGRDLEGLGPQLPISHIAAMQAELFELPRMSRTAAPEQPPLPEAAGLVTPAEEAQLIARIDTSGLEPFRFRQWNGRRMTRSYGWRYDFEGNALLRGDPLPDWLVDLRRRVVAAFGFDPRRFEQVLLIRYGIGAGLGWHRDRPVFGRVIGLSLGSDGAMRLRRRLGPRQFDRATLPLPARGAYLLDGAARRDWEHSLAPVTVPRWSITFRELAEPSEQSLLPKPPSG